VREEVAGTGTFESQATTGTYRLKRTEFVILPADFRGASALFN